PDLRYVVRVTEAIAEHLRPGQLISLESTTYPGTTEEVMLPILPLKFLSKLQEGSVPRGVSSGGADYRAWEVQA
ncbi:MAG: UDP-N-acetyl-D-glucosamine dehydrogenase, partial [Thermus sp.]